MSEDKVRAHVWVSGRVQGVFFRQATNDQAKEKRVNGWIRNLEDGRVEAVLEGPGTVVRTLLDWLQVGPPQARVEDVKVQWEEVQEELGFRVR